MDDWARYVDGGVGTAAAGRRTHRGADRDGGRRRFTPSYGASSRAAAALALRPRRVTPAHPGGQGNCRPQAGLRPGTDRIDDDKHGGGEDVSDDGGTTQVLGDEPVRHRERLGAAVVEGFEGEAQLPLASPLCTQGVCKSL